MYKPNLPLLLLAILFCQQAFSQMTATPSLGWSTFVKGMTGVDNKFIIPDNSYDEVYVVFTGNHTYDSLPASLVNGDWELSHDMGSLDDETVSVSLYAFDQSGQEIQSAIDYNQLSLLPEPIWLSSTYNGSVSVTSVDDGNNTISFDAELPLKSAFNDVIPNNIKGLGDKALDISAILHYSGVYTIANHTTDCPADPSLTVSLSFVTGTEEFNLPINSSISVDDSFNPILTITEIKDFGEFSRSLPISKIPITPPVCLSIDANFSVNPKIKGQIVLGMDNNGDWGFVDNNGETTSLLGKVTAKASINGSVQALCGIKRSSIAKGSIGLEANIGGGASYTTASGLSPVFGGDFRVYGSLSFPWPFKKYGIHEATLYGPVDFGDTTGLSFKVASEPDSVFGAWGSTSRNIETDTIPDAWPFGTLSARDSGLVVAWIDDVNVGAGSSKVELAYYDPYNNTFGEPVTIEENDYGIHNLSVALLPNGNTALTWVQSRYNNSEIENGNMTMDDVMESEDIWLAVYNPTIGQLSYKERIADDISQNQSGRSEGNPHIVWSSADSGLIVWEVADNSSSDIYYATISINAGIVSVSAPATISSNLSGLNYSPIVAYTDPTHALALWINDADSDDSTSNTMVYESSWGGSAWSSPAIHYNLPAGTEVKELSLQTNGLYGIEAITYQGYLADDDNLVNGVAIGTWDNGNPNSIVYQVEEDSLYYYQLPKASISANGIASIVLQVRDVTDPEDEGSLEMYLKDIVNGNSWEEVSETSQSNYLHYLNDTLNTIWEMGSTFGYYNNGSRDILYLLTQETDSADNTTVSYGSILGNPNLHLVLRAFEVESNGGNISLQDVEEPEDTAIFNSIVSPDYAQPAFTLSQNIPNPLRDYTQIRFTIPSSAVVSLEVWDNLGIRVNTLVNRSILPAGNYTTDYHPGDLPNGIYHYRLMVNNETITRHMIVER